MEKVEIAPGIVVYKNILPESKLLIDEIENCIQENIVSLAKSSVIAGDYSGVDTKIRNTDTIGISYLNGVNEDYYSPQDSFFKTLNNYFYEAFTSCENDYKNMFGITTEWHDDWSLLKYGVGQFFSNHIDDGKVHHRRVSTVYYMNEDYQGGEIQFPRFNISYKPKAHELLIFPSNYVYNHSVNEVTEGSRYAVVSWLR